MKKKADWKKPGWLSEEEADSLHSNVHALIINDGLTAFLRVDVLTALKTERAEVVVERVDTGEPVFRITCKKELKDWVKLFDRALRDFKSTANKQMVSEMEGGKE